MGKLILILSDGTIQQTTGYNARDALYEISEHTRNICAWRFETTTGAITGRIDAHIREQNNKAELIGDQTRVKIRNLINGIY
jgi:hypothetical protein